MKVLRHVVCVVVSFALLLPAPLLAQQTDAEKKAAKKAAEQKAKAVAAEGKNLEKEKKYLEAREKFIDAQEIAVTGDGANGLLRVNETIRKEVEKLMKASREAVDAGQTDKAMKSLQDALVLKPQEPAIFWGMAIIELKAGRTENAL